MSKVTEVEAVKPWIFVVHFLNDFFFSFFLSFFLSFFFFTSSFFLNEQRIKMIGYVLLTSAANLYLLQFVSERTFFENVPYMFGGHDAKRMEAMY